MVKLQKPNPKTLNKDGNKDKPKKSNNFKKEKQPEAKNPIPASNVTAKKEKIKLIEKTIKEQPETLVKPTKKEKKNKCASNVQQPQKEEQVVDKTNKKNKKKAQHQAPAAVETKVEVKQEGKKAAKVVAVSQDSNQQKVPKGQKRKAPVAPAKAQENGKVEEKAPVTKSQKKKKGKKQKQTATKGDKETDAPPMPTVPFDEEKFNTIVTVPTIKKVGQALKTMVEKQVTEKKTAIFDDFRYFLNVCCFKIPNCPKRIVKLNLAHSLVNPSEDDVVIVVPDLKRGAKADYEPTIQHYEDLFREHDITGLKIVPFNQLRKECTTIEAKRKFANTYDYFLCDGRIVSHVVGFCGNHFQRTRSNFHAVRLDNPKTYKRDVEHALKRTSYKQLHKGDLISIPVGTHRFTVDQLTDNIKLVVDQLKTLFPGGLGNVRNMHVKIDIKGTTSLPIYTSVGAPPAETPNVIGMREQRMLKLKKEANEVLSQFNMSKTGEFVKLDRAQAERKRQIQEARKAVLTEASSDNVENDGEEEVPAKKSKKSKKEVKEEPQPAVEDEEEEDDEDDDEEGDDDDDEEEDDDDDDVADSDEE